MQWTAALAIDRFLEPLHAVQWIRSYVSLEIDGGQEIHNFCRGDFLALAVQSSRLSRNAISENAYCTD